MATIIPSRKRFSVPDWLVALLVSSALIFMTGWLGQSLMFQERLCTPDSPEPTVPWYGHWDGAYYNQIVEYGYAGQVGMHDGMAVFFPLYPLLGKGLQFVTGAPSTTCLLIVSLMSLTALGFVWQRYCRLRFPERPYAANMAMLLLFFWPTSLFLRMNYTESLFILLVVLMFYGFLREWKLSRLILIAGLASATRPTGFLCAIVLGYHVWLDEPRHGTRRLLYAGLCAAAGVWGLFAYMGYLHLQFGDPWLFFTEHKKWDLDWAAKLYTTADLFQLAPITRFFADGSWHNARAWPWEMLNKHLWLLSGILVLIGRMKKWITKEEFLFSVLMLLLIYAGTAPSRVMMSAGRNALAIFPVYIVLASMLKRQVSGHCVLAACTGLLVFFTAMFAAAMQIN